MKKELFFSVVTVILLATSSAYAEEDEKLNFASAIEQMLGHLHALEINLDDGNNSLAEAHATHPIAELYEVVKPAIVEEDADFDAEFESALSQLKSNTVGVPRQDAQLAIEHVRDLIGQAKTLVLGDLNDDVNFKLKVVKSLVETAGEEYEEAVQDGTIKEMVEYQDGSAFVWQAMQIFEEIKSDLPENEAEEIEGFFVDLESAIKDTMPFADIEIFVGDISLEIDEILGEEDQQEDLGTELAGLPPLQQIKKGVEPSQVTCSSQMVLLIKNSNGMPACVKPHTAERLVQIGWGTTP